MGAIGTIRKHSWIAVAIVGVAIVAFIIGDLTKNNNKMPDLGRIGSTTITYQRFNDMVEEQEQNYQRQYNVAQVPAEMQARIREGVWQQLVGETLTDAEFAKLGLTVSPAEVNDMYKGTFIHPELRQYFTNPQTGEYDIRTVEYYISNIETLDTAERLQWAQLEKAVKKSRCQQKYSSLIAGGFYMPKAIANQIAKMSSTVTNANIVSLPYQTVAEEEVALTDADYEKYYQAHKNEYRVREEQREIEYILYPIVPTQKDLADIQADVEKVWGEFQEQNPDELVFFVNAESDRSYYSTFRRAEEFTTPMDSAIRSAAEGSFISPRMVGNEWQMAKVLKIENRPDSMRASTIYIFNERVGGTITRGDEQAKQLADSVKNLVASGAMSFEEAVNQFSDDPQKANNKGDMEWQLDGNFGFLNEKMINTPEGGIFVMQHPSEIGYFVVKVTGKTAPHRKYRVATIARAIVASEATTRNIYNEANRFAGNNRTLSAMTSAAQAENLQVRNTLVYAMSQNLSRISNARSIVQWAFNEKTEIGAVADQIFEADDHYIVAALKDVYKVGYKTLEQARPEMENMVRIEKRAEILKERANEAKNGCSDLATIATKLSSTVDTLDSVAFNDYYLAQFGMEPKVQAAIVATTGNDIVGPLQGSNGVYLVKVNNKADNPKTVDPESIRNQYQMSYRQKVGGVLVVLMDNTKIVDQRKKFF